MLGLPEERAYLWRYQGQFSADATGSVPQCRRPFGASADRLNRPRTSWPPTSRDDMCRVAAAATSPGRGRWRFYFRGGKTSTHTSLAPPLAIHHPVAFETATVH